MALTAGEEYAPIKRFAHYWKRKVCPFKGDSRERYLDLAPIYNAASDGILHKIIAIEEEIIRFTDRRLDETNNMIV